MNHDNIEAAPEETAPEDEQGKIDAVTSFTVVMTLDGTVALTEAPLNNLRPPSQLDLRMAAWFLHDQLNENPPPPAQKSDADRIREKLAARK